jgi:hypothetical protein
MGLAGLVATTAGKFAAGIIVLVIGVAAVGGGLYASDYGFEATVTDTECRVFGESTVTVRPKVIPMDLTQPIGATECGIVQAENFVVYNIRTERVRIYEREGGTLLWDSEWLAQMGGSGGLLPR